MTNPGPMTNPEPTPIWPDPTSPPPPSPPTVPLPDVAAPSPPLAPAPPEFSVGSASVPAPPGFSPPDPGYNPSDHTAVGYGAPGYPVTGMPASTYGGYGGFSGQPGYGAPPAYYPGYAPPTKTNSMAVASMVVSIAGAVLLFCYGVGGVVGAVGAILGHVSRRQIRERQESGNGMALAGIITGWIATALGLLIMALIAVFIVWAANNPYDPSLNDTVLNS